MIKQQMIRVLALISLLIASLCIVGQETQFCIYDYFAPDQITYLNELNGGIAKDPVVFAGCAMAALLFFIPLLLSYHRGWYVFFFIVLILIQFIFLFMIESNSLLKLIFDSVKYCDNYRVLAWAIGQTLFVLFSLIFIFSALKQ